MQPFPATDRGSIGSDSSPARGGTCSSRQAAPRGHRPLRRNSTQATRQRSGRLVRCRATKHCQIVNHLPYQQPVLPATSAPLDSEQAKTRPLEECGMSNLAFVQAKGMMIV